MAYFGILWYIVVCYGILVIHPQVQNLSRIHPGVLPGCRGAHSTDGQQLANPSANLMEKASPPANVGKQNCEGEAYSCLRAPTLASVMNKQDHPLRARMKR